MELRYIRNIGAITPAEQEALGSARVFVAGCGGLGGGVVDCLARLGVGGVLCDCDVFDETNLNRQLICSGNTLGRQKAEAACEYARAVNPCVRFEPVCERITRENSVRLVSGCGLVIDALDNAESRLALAKACDELGVPLVSGAVEGWCAQVCVFAAGDAERGIAALFDPAAAKAKPPVLPFTALGCASVMSAEAAKLLLGRPSELLGKLLCLDMLNNDRTVFWVARLAGEAHRM